MSYTTGTTHYNLPQTVGSDKRDWTDTNEAFSDVDAALWEAHQGATQAALDIASINSEIQTITGKQADDEADIATISGKVSTLETTVANHTTEIGDVRRDLQDNIESLREDTATSTHAYEIGDYFYYNDVLFKATAQIAIGATIVPNTNCTGVTVMDELKNGGAVSIDASDVTYGSSNVEDALDDKIDTFSGSVADASQNTYTAVTADGIAYDATNDQLLLKVNGADTVIPFSRGGGSIVDVNPTKTNDFTLTLGIAPNGQVSYIPIAGYSKVYLKADSFFTFVFADADQQALDTSHALDTTTWHEFAVPSGAVLLKVTGTYSSASQGTFYFSLEV